MPSVTTSTSSLRSPWGLGHFDRLCYLLTNQMCCLLLIYFMSFFVASVGCFFAVTLGRGFTVITACYNKCVISHTTPTHISPLFVFFCKEEKYKKQ